MIEVIAFDIAGGEGRKSLGVFESVQMTGTELRDENDNLILYLGRSAWRDRDDKGWYDWTVSVA